MRRFALVLSLLIVSLGGIATARYPEPKLVSPSWQLDFSYSTPRRIVVNVPGEPLPKAYWYMTYTATNNTGQERIFLPRFEMLTSDGRVLLADFQIPAAVYDAIARREKNPLMKPALELAGSILEGEDYAKYGVAIWPEPSAEPGTFSIFVQGLSGEAVNLETADGSPVLDKEGKPIILRKTKQIDVKVKGDELYAGDPVSVIGETWVMR